MVQTRWSCMLLGGRYANDVSVGDSVVCGQLDAGNHVNCLAFQAFLAHLVHKSSILACKPKCGHTELFADLQA